MIELLIEALRKRVRKFNTAFTLVDTVAAAAVWSINQKRKKKKSITSESIFRVLVLDFSTFYFCSSNIGHSLYEPTVLLFQFSELQSPFSLF